MKFALKSLAFAVTAAATLPNVAFAVNPATVPAANRIYIAGASAADFLLGITITRDLCDSQIDMLNNGRTNFWGVACVAKTQAQDSSIPAAIAGQPIVVLKHSQGGSAVGVTNEVQSLGASQVDIASCAAGGTTSAPYAAYGNYNCAGTTAALPIDVGMSDVDPIMFRGVNKPSTGSDVTAGQVNQLTYKASVGNLFGVVVNTKLRNALQTAQGLISGSDAEDQQPNLTQAQVVTLIKGNISDWSKFNVDVAGVPTPLTAVPGVIAPGSTSVKICRRVAGSGTQAVGNAIIFNNPCDAKALAPKVTGTFQGAGAGDVEKCLQAWETATTQTITGDAGASVTVNGGTPVTGWAIGGSMGLERPVNANYRWVKFDGEYPSAKNAHDGKYKFWAEQTLQFKTAEGSVLYSWLSNNLTKATNVKQVNDLLPRDAYLALGNGTGNVADAIWNRNNPVVGYMHSASNTGTPNACQIPVWNNINQPNTFGIMP